MEKVATIKYRKIVAAFIIAAVSVLLPLATVHADTNTTQTSCSFISMVWHGNLGTCAESGLIYAITLALVSVSALILHIVVSLFDWVFQWTVLDFGGFLGGTGSDSSVMTAITNAWGAFRDIANILIIAMLVYASIRTILGIREYGAKGLVARVIIIAILINFSLLFTKIAIDTSNFVATQFYTKYPAASSSESGQSQQMTLAESFENMTGIDSITKTADHASDLSKSGGFASALMYAIFLPLILLATAIVLLYGSYILLARALIFVFLMLTSSIAFASYLIPGKGESIAWRPWLNALFNNALVAPVLIVLLWVAITVGRAFQQVPILKDGTLSGLTSATPGDVAQNPSFIAGIIGYVVTLSLLYFAFSTSSRLSRATAGKWSAAVDTRVRGFATNGVARFGGVSWQQTAQRLALRRGESNQTKAETHRNLALQSTTNAAFARQAGREQEAKRHEAQAAQNQRMAASFEQRSERYRNFANKQNIGGIEGLGKRIERRAKEAESLAKRVAPTRDERQTVQTTVREEAARNIETAREPNRTQMQEAHAQAEQQRSALEPQLARAQTNAATVQNDANEKKEAIRMQRDAIMQELTRQAASETDTQKKDVIQKEIEKQTAEHSSALSAQDERIKTANAEVQRITTELGKLDEQVAHASKALTDYDKQTAGMISSATAQAAKTTEETFAQAREGAVRQAVRAGSIITPRPLDEDSIVAEALRNNRRSDQSNARLREFLKEFGEAGAASPGSK